jgi:hypothetical protein
MLEDRKATNPMQFFDRMRRQKLLSLSLLVFTLAIGIVIGTVANTGVWAARAQVAAPDATPLVIPAASTTTMNWRNW